MKAIVFWNFFIVFFVGVFWGMVEIITSYDLRYVCGDKKKRRQKQNEVSGKVLLEKEENALFYVFCYLLLNGVMSVISLLLLIYYSNETICDITVIEINKILIAGFGGIILLRSSVFSFFKDNREISVGMITIVKLLLDKIDKKIKHNIAAKRICEIYEVMKDVDYDKAKDELPYLCINYIDDFSERDSKDLIRAIKEINGNLSGVNKSLQLGREIARYCDVEILKRAVKKLPIKNGNSQQGGASPSEKDEFETRKEQLYKK